MSKLAVIFGGSGFVGRYIARRLAKEGWRVRVAVRRPNEAGFVRPYGAVGQVEPVFCNIRDNASVAAALVGATAAINCVGSFDRDGRNNFEAVQAEGAGRIARLAAAGGVERLVHISAIGASAESDSEYFRSKAEGETNVLAAFPSAMILRPSAIFGPEDGLFNYFASMTRFVPFVMPLFSAATKFQPVYVDDVAAAAVKGVTEGTSGIYELGGPDVVTLEELVRYTLKETNRRRAVLKLPHWMARLAGWKLDLASKLTLGLFSNRILTRDQVRQLQSDCVVGAGASGLADLGIAATDMGAIVPGYLYSYRPSGQYDAIKESAKWLRNS